MNQMQCSYTACCVGWAQYLILIELKSHSVLVCLCLYPFTSDEGRKPVYLRLDHVSLCVGDTLQHSEKITRITELQLSVLMLLLSYY